MSMQGFEGAASLRVRLVVAIAATLGVVTLNVLLTQL